MGPQSPARHRRLSARPRAPAELPELGASTGRGAARGRAAERRWRSASRSADRPRLPPGKLKASFTMRTRENRTAASRAGGVVGGGPGGPGPANSRRVGPTRHDQCVVRDAPGASGPTRTLLTLRLVYYTHMLPSRGARRRQGTPTHSTVRVLLLGTLYTAQRTPAPIARISTRTLQYLA